MGYLKQIEQAAANGKIEKNAAQTLHDFYFSYVNAAQSNGFPLTEAESLLQQFLKLIFNQFVNPFSFDSFHQRVLEPYNYYQFGVEFIRPIVMSNASKVLHLDHLNRIETQLAKGDNVILLANHQTELDPQAISLALEKTHPPCRRNDYCCRTSCCERSSRYSF